MFGVFVRGVFWAVLVFVPLHYIKKHKNIGPSRKVQYVVASPSYSSSQKSSINYNFCLKNEQRCDQYKEMLEDEAKDAGFLSSWERKYILAMAEQESRLDPEAKNASGARGLMGVKPIAAIEVKMNPDSLDIPEYNIKAGLRYLKKLQTEKFGGDFIKAVVAYNVGPASFDSMVERGEITDPAKHRYIKALKKHF